MITDTTIKGFRLSPHQKRLWSLQQDSFAYVTQGAVFIEGNLQTDILKAALQQVVNRHGILRTSFYRLSSVKIPVMVVADSSSFFWQDIDFIDYQAQEQSSKIEEIFQEVRHQGFNFEQGKILHSSLLKLSQSSYILLISLPAICADSWTIKHLVNDIIHSYSHCLEGKESSNEVVQYLQFSELQNQLLKDGNAEVANKYWQEQKLTAQATLRLPFEKRYTKQSEFQSDCFRFTINPDLTAKIAALAQKCDSSIDFILLSCWQILIWRLTGQSEFIIGMAVARRDYEELHNLLGLVATWIPFKSNLTPVQNFREVVEFTEKTIESAWEWQDYFVPETVENNHTIPFPIGFEFERLPEQILVADVSFYLNKYYSCIEPFKVKLTATQSDNWLTAEFYYDVNYFSNETIALIAGQFQTLLTSAITNPDQNISQLEILSQSDRQKLLVEFNQTQIDYSQQKCIHQLFAEQVERTPNNIAVIFENQQLTYAELNSQANQLAHYLRSLGVKPEVVVGLYLERSLKMIIGLLGILKAGGAYLPIDPGLPQVGLVFRLQDAQVSVLLTQQHLVDNLLIDGTQVICLDQNWDAIAQNKDENPIDETTIENLVYIIYTSGSTGNPKGVAVEHRQLLNYLNAILDKLDLPPNSNFAIVSSFAADLGNTAIFPALCNGGCLHVVSQERSADPSALAAYFDLYPIDCLKIVPSHLAVLLRSSHSEKILPRKCLILGGETVSWQLIEQLQHYLADCKIFNHYGPTETTVGVLTYLVKQQQPNHDSETVPIGCPLANTQVYVLDQQMQPVPLGVSGELYIGGAGLARGYLHHPELNATKFIPSPFSDTAKAKLYKTGDKVRYLRNGNLEFLGRIDNQIKVRGFRIEPEEIELALKQHPQVQEVVVIAWADKLGDKRLVAYIIPRLGQRSSTSELRVFLKNKLPEYMVPSTFVLLKKLPLTPNGKVDRLALPAPDTARPDLEDVFVAPRTPVEKLLAKIWSEVLRLEQVGIHDNFFNLGGHSLLATQVMSRLQDSFDVDLALRDLFDMPTIATLAMTIAQRLAQTITELEQLSPKEPAPRPKITHQSRDSYIFPLSFAQQRLWFLEQLTPGNPFYNQSVAIRLTGDLNLTALEQTFNEIIRRHEVLRTTFTIFEEQPVQIIAPTLALKLLVVDLQTLPEAEREIEIMRFATKEAQLPFNRLEAPLLRYTLLRLGLTEYVLLFTMHHIISDAWSKEILIREVAILYKAFSSGQVSPLAELPIQYADFAVWQRQWLQGDVLQSQISYWKKQLEGIPLILDLPTDYPRPSVQTFQGTTYSFELSVELSQALKQLSLQQESTLFMTLLAAFQTLLWRYTGQEDIVVGSPIANRNRAEIEGLIGFFVNTLVLRTNLASNPTFQELLIHVREMTLGAYAHQDLPFEQLVEELQTQRSLSHTPLFQVMFVLQNTSMLELELTGLNLSLLASESGSSKFDLTLLITETAQGLVGSFEYNTSLFESSTISRMAGHLKTLLSGIVANPQQHLSELPLLTQAEQALLVEWNHTQVEYPQQCIHQLFEAQVERTPNAVAVVFDLEQLSYYELNARANQLAHHLRTLEVGPEVLVGICVERSLEMIIGLLGILKAGGAYVPLDPTYPQERLAFILKDTQVSVLLTQNKLLSKLPENDIHIICLDTDWEVISQETEKIPDSSVTPFNLAYVIYTSGSTGEPKGVQITHRNLVHSTTARITYYKEPVTSFLLLSSFAFDSSVAGIFATLCSGGILCLPQVGLQLEISKLVELIAQNQVSHLLSLPSLYALLLQEAKPEQLKSVHTVIVAGEPCLTELVQCHYQLQPQTSLFNEYGPTEGTVWSSVYHCHSQQTRKQVSIGKPIANTQIYILDSHLHPVPIGVRGEIHISGDGLARGYMNQPALTSEKFIPNPFSDEPGTRLYKTGDLACYLSDGNIEFLGRIDHQVKIRGYRIELGEIEAAITHHPAVRETVVVLCSNSSNSSNSQLIIAYVVSHLQQTLTITELHHFLESKLPNYMIPTAFVMLEALPLTPNGKVDRKALTALNTARPELAVAYQPPQTEIEQTIAKIWLEVLHVNDVGIHDNFFELGGHSLLLLQAHNKLHKIFESDLSVLDLFRYPTINSLANYLNKVGNRKHSFRAGDIDIDPKKIEAGKIHQRKRQQKMQNNGNI
jgi:amino acid adenylation domain-containing protein